MYRVELTSAPAVAVITTLYSCDGQTKVVKWLNNNRL